MNGLKSSIFILFLSAFISCNASKVCFNPNEESLCNCADRDNNCFEKGEAVQQQIARLDNSLSGKALSIKCVANKPSLDGLYTYRLEGSYEPYKLFFLYDEGKVQLLSTEKYGSFKSDVKSFLKKKNFDKEKIRKVLLMLDNMVLYQ